MNGNNQYLKMLFGLIAATNSPFIHAEFHGTLTATTNNTYRWFSKSDNEGALMANIDYEHSSGFYAGGSASNVEFEFNEIEHQAAHVEITPYAGWALNLSDQVRLDLQWTGYLYDGNVFGHAADYHEFYLLLHYKDLVSARVAVADDYYGLGTYALDYAITGRYPITDALKLSAEFGYAHTQNALGSDYPYWNFGITYAYKYVKLGLSYMDATETAITADVVEQKHALYDPPVLDAAGVFSISAGF